ncbi:hypothetical protein L596_009555 [Steinernema carpocapsae]|uniref:Uncharacterized protein n=1 Tax=Steinernema carpocapsae TaxID=34508 RepID=A0A4U5PG71_STECR|nr:hypothetical protein L596_009555 [Steinernema carpocapsae]
MCSSNPLNGGKFIVVSLLELIERQSTLASVAESAQQTKKRESKARLFPDIGMTKRLVEETIMIALCPSRFWISYLSITRNAQ